MRVLFSFDDLDTRLPYPVASVGNFDGVHLGHRRILDELKARAHHHGGVTVLVTFNPHPQRVLHPDSAPRLIATPQQKRRLLEQAGLDVLVELPFTRELASLDPEEFVQRILLDGLGVREVHIGRNFRFGRNRGGDFETLERLGRVHGFVAGPVDGVRHRDERISSSRIRAALAGGEVELAAEMLGREPELTATVVRGDGRGRTLGFPTANLEVENELVPFTGVYVTRLHADGRRLDSVTNIGSRPTFPGAGPAVETHALDFTGDLYGQSVSLRFVHRIRDEMKFPGIEALRRQIAADVDEARRALSG